MTARWQAHDRYHRVQGVTESQHYASPGATSRQQRGVGATRRTAVAAARCYLTVHDIACVWLRGVCVLLDFPQYPRCISAGVTLPYQQSPGPRRRLRGRRRVAGRTRRLPAGHRWVLVGRGGAVGAFRDWLVAWCWSTLEAAGRAQLGASEGWRMPPGATTADGYPGGVLGAGG